MVAAQRMVETVPGLALVYTGAPGIPGTCTCLSAHVLIVTVCISLNACGISFLKYISRTVLDLSLGFYVQYFCIFL